MPLRISPDSRDANHTEPSPYFRANLGQLLVWICLGLAALGFVIYEFQRPSDSPNKVMQPKAQRIPRPSSPPLPIEYEPTVLAPTPRDDPDIPFEIKAARIGDWLRVGPIKWRVTKVKGLRRLRGSFDKWLEADGAGFIVVYMEARLVGPITKRVDADQLYLLDRPTDATYKPDSDAQWHANYDYLTSKQLHPNITVPLRTAFDVPAGITEPILVIDEPDDFSLSRSGKSRIGVIPLSS